MSSQGGLQTRKTSRSVNTFREIRTKKRVNNEQTRRRSLTQKKKNRRRHSSKHQVRQTEK
jgi:hypothetical protein